MPFRRWAVSSVILTVFLLTLRVSAAVNVKQPQSIYTELPVASALCVVCNNVLRLDQHLNRMEMRIMGTASQFDELTPLKMVLGPYWNINAPLAFIIPTPAKGGILTMRNSVLILQATNTAKFIAGLKNGATKGGITPARIEGSPAYIATRGPWIFLSASRAELKHYLRAKRGLTLNANMTRAMHHADISVEGDARAVKADLLQPLQAAILPAFQGNQFAKRNTALRAVTHQLDDKIGQQLIHAFQRSVLTVHVGRQALVIDILNRLHASTPFGKLVASQTPLPANALAGLPNMRYSALFANSINGAAVSRWLNTMLPTATKKQSQALREIRSFSTLVAGHTGTSAIVLPPIHTPAPAGAAMVNSLAIGPIILITRSDHPKAQMRHLSNFLKSQVAVKTGKSENATLTDSRILGYAAVGLNIAAKPTVESLHHIEMVDIGTHRVLVAVNAPRKLLLSALAAAKKQRSAIARRPGLAQSLDKILPQSFVTAYWPIGRWNQGQAKAAVPKAAHALTLGLPPPPAVFSVGTGKKSLNMQLYIPVATLEQSLSGNSAGALF